ncbi:MAG: hypothetical protein FWG28_05100 [Clostridiales bacterium]|nr:hypothetical protein [Clostridiales bacterium]
MNTNAKRFYFMSFAALAILSAYPLINGARMAYISVTSGALQPEQYAKYVVPYAAICVSLLYFAALQPLFFRLKRFAFPVGIATTYGVFFALERFFETMQIHVAGMTLVDASTLAPDAAGSVAATADLWQASLCMITPVIQTQSLTYAALYRTYYVAGDNAYKIHYYLISLILITMVCGLIYSIAKLLRGSDRDMARPVYLRGISTAALVALCIFANTTAFFRQAAPVQTPLASSLTAVFFIALGAAVGIYAGSFLLGKGIRLGIGVPVSLSLCTTALMYAGEAAMMKGNLYRFGTGWFFRGLPGVALAAVDILIVLLSGGLAWLILGMARKREFKPGKGTLIAAVAICAAVAVSGPMIAMTSPRGAEYAAAGIFGCYVFDENIYTNPLSSFIARGELPYTYCFEKDAFFITDTSNGSIRSHGVEYYKTPVDLDPFFLLADELFDPFHSLPDLARFSERYLLAVMSDEGGPIGGLYRMDDELWLLSLSGGRIWSIYRIIKTDAATPVTRPRP